MQMKIINKNKYKNYFLKLQDLKNEIPKELYDDFIQFLEDKFEYRSEWRSVFVSAGENSVVDLDLKDTLLVNIFYTYLIHSNKFLDILNKDFEYEFSGSNGNLRFLKVLNIDPSQLHIHKQLDEDFKYLKSFKNDLKYPYELREDSNQYRISKNNMWVVYNYYDRNDNFDLYQYNANDNFGIEYLNYLSEEFTFQTINKNDFDTNRLIRFIQTITALNLNEKHQKLILNLDKYKQNHFDYDYLKNYPNGYAKRLHQFLMNQVKNKNGLEKLVLNHFISSFKQNKLVMYEWLNKNYDLSKFLKVHFNVDWEKVKKEVDKNKNKDKEDKHDEYMDLLNAKSDWNEDDFLYFDPPYFNNLKAYQHQIDTKTVLENIIKFANTYNSVKIAISFIDNELITELFKNNPNWKIYHLDHKNSNTSFAFKQLKQSKEILITNY